MKNFLENNAVKPETLLNLFSQAPVALAVLKGENMIIEAANPLMRNIMGLDEDSIGLPLLEDKPIFANTDLIVHLKNVYKNNGKQQGREQKFTFKKVCENQIFNYDFTYAPLKNSNEEIVGVIVMANDVTEKVLAKIERKESDSRFRNLVMESEIPTVFFRGEDLIVDVINDKARQYWGKSYDVVGLKLEDALPELKNQPIIEILKNVYSTGEIYREDAAKVDFEYDGVIKTFYINLSYKPIRNIHGEIYGILNMGVDVTQQVLTNRALSTSEERLREVIASVPFAISVLKGNDFVIEMSNQGTTDLWKKNENRIGRKLSDVYPEMKDHPIMEYLKKAYETGKQIRIKEEEVKIPQFDNSRFMNYIFTPIGLEEDEKTIISVGQDVTDELQLKKNLQESELRFKSMADTVPQIIWSAEPNGEVDYFNERWYEFSGLPRGKEFLKNWADLLHPDDFERVLQTWKDSLETGTYYDIEYRLEDRRNPGTYRWFLARGIPAKSSSGEILKWSGSNTDIHDFKMFQKQKDDFLAITSHELKTPLTSIKLYAQALERMMKKEGNEKAADYASKLEGQVDRLSNLVTDLLDVTKIENGKLQLKESEFDFDELAHEVVQHFRISFPRHEIIFHNNKAGEAFADRSRISQVMTNFISNGIKYSPKSEKIVVQTFCDDAGNAGFSVKDFGIGLPQDKLEKIFEQFYRVHEDEDNTFEGLGLGLYIASEIIHRSNGNIKVTSKINEGSKFCFTIPKKRTSNTVK